MNIDRKDVVICDICVHPVYEDRHIRDRYNDVNQKLVKINLCESEVFPESIFFEMQGEKDKPICEGTPDLRIHREDVPRLIFALQWMIAGPLGRVAIERDIETYEASHAA